MGWNVVGETSNPYLIVLGDPELLRLIGGPTQPRSGGKNCGGLTTRRHGAVYKINASKPSKRIGDRFFYRC